jgi:toxin ParE1/3/4
MVRINWLIEARNDLKEIHEYISLDSKRYAQLQVERIQGRTEILKKHPRLGKRVVEIDNKEILELIEGNYRIIYRLKSEKEIDILLIHHSARDLKRRI